MANSSIGQFIAALRKANGMTQQEVAERLNVSNKSVSRWERDESAPDLSVIPALAEMFGVTCDELLKGERIITSQPQEKKEHKVEKQVKSLINRTLSGFRTLILISLTVSAIGLICMFGISYGFYRPVIGFAVMLLFEVCALVIAVLAVNRTKDVKTFNELFCEADESLISKFDNTLGSFSFVAFFAIVAVVSLSLPLVLLTSDYVKAVMAISSYFLFFFGGIVLILTLVFLKCKRPYIAWITGNKLPPKCDIPVSKSKSLMTKIQLSLTILAGFIFVTAPYLDSNPNESTLLYEIITYLGLACLLASIICFAVFLIRQRENRKKLILPGIRNLLLIPSALISSEMHSVSWTLLAPDENGCSADSLTRYDSWNTEYFWYAFALAILVYIIFALIDILIEKIKK